MRFFTKIISPLLVLLVTPSLVFADTPVHVEPPANNQFNKLFDFTDTSFGGVVGKVVTIAFILATVIALFFLVYGGVKWITSGGDKAAVESARNTIVAAVIGLVIVFLSYFILNIVLGFFGLKLTDLVLPTLTP